MNRAEFLKTANTESGGNGLYPLSIQGLDFLQAQAQLLESLSLIGGKRYIIKAPQPDSPGLIVIDGELLPLEYGKGAAIRVREVKEDIVADGVTYTGARVRRTAYYVDKFVDNTVGLYPASGFQMIQSNDSLAKKLQEYAAVNSELAKKLTVISTDCLTRVQLDAQQDNLRIHCRKGCFLLNGAEEYTINIYRHSSNNITQEQILPDMRRFVRYWDTAAKKWGGFFPVTENLHIDVKIVNATVYIRHGFIPEGVNLVLLRKKKRGRKRRSGGLSGTNPLWHGRVMLRQPKNQYAHYKGVILSTSSPNNWYVPKCVGVADKSDNDLIGKELGKICSGMIKKKESRLGGVIDPADSVYLVSGTSVKASKKGYSPNTQASCYVRIALQFANAGRSFKSAGGEMARMKYRLWFECRRSYLTEGSGYIEKTIVRRGFSAD